MIDSDFQFYTFMLVLSIILGICAQIYIASKNGFYLKELILYLIFELIGVWLGAKFFTYIFINPNHINFLDVGLNSSGALFGAIIIIILYSIIFHKNCILCLSIFIYAAPLIYSIGKIGCFIVGCCEGFVYNGIGNVSYNYVPNPTGLSYFPIQIIESITFLIAFCYIISRFNKETKETYLLGKCFIICGTLKFILDCFRLEHVGKIITKNQLFSLIMIAIGIIISLYNYNQYNKYRVIKNRSRAG